MQLAKKVKVWVLVYSIAYMSGLKTSSPLQSQKCMAADWHEYKLVIPRRIMRPSIARDSEQMDLRCSTPTT